MIKDYAVGAHVFAENSDHIFRELKEGNWDVLEGVERWEPYENYSNQEIGQWILEEYENLCLFIIRHNNRTINRMMAENEDLLRSTKGI